MARMGRPKTENPKNIRFSILLDKEMDMEFQKYCEEKGIAKAEAVRRAITLFLSQEDKSICSSVHNPKSYEVAKENIDLRKIIRKAIEELDVGLKEIEQATPC